jgi:hypothetical protein
MDITGRVHLGLISGLGERVADHRGQSGGAAALGPERD